MVWTDITRAQHCRRDLRYASDCRDVEWDIIEPLLPAKKRLGRLREVDLRDVWDAIQYIAATGCQWAMLPTDFPVFTTVQRYFYAWRDSGLLAQVNATLVAVARELCGREGQPTAGIIDSQSVKTTESGGIWGYDAGKKIKGRKRHILTDTIGFIVHFVVHGADIQDRDGAPNVLKGIRHSYPWLRHIFADGGYAGPKLRSKMQKQGKWTFNRH